MLTAHRRLDPQRIGGTLPGWEILNDALEVVATVRTKREAERIVKAQKVED